MLPSEIKSGVWYSSTPDAPWDGRPRICWIHNDTDLYNICYAIFGVRSLMPLFCSIDEFAKYSVAEMSEDDIKAYDKEQRERFLNRV